MVHDLFTLNLLREKISIHIDIIDIFGQNIDIQYIDTKKKMIFAITSILQ